MRLLAVEVVSCLFLIGKDLIELLHLLDASCDLIVVSAILGKREVHLVEGFGRHTKTAPGVAVLRAL
jgi:hypothetical protein